MYWRIQADNFFTTTLDTLIDDTTSVGTFDVVNKTVNWYTLEDWNYIFWMTVWLQNPDEVEIFRITNVSWYTLTYDRRISPKGIFSHAIWQLAVMTVGSDFINWISNNTSDFWYTETITWVWNELKTKTYWGKIFLDWVANATVPEATLTYAINTTNYVYLDDADNTFKSTTIEPIDYYVLSQVITDGTTVTSITDWRWVVLSGWGWGGWGGWHVIKNTDQSGVVTTLTQRATIRTKKLKTTDDNINLETVIEGKRLATPDVIPTGTTEYIESGEQMIVYGWLTVDWTLDNEWTLVIL